MSTLSKPTTREDVIAAYRLMLCREPESDAAVEHVLKDFSTLGALRDGFMRSSEFAAISNASRPQDDLAVVSRHYFEEPEPVEVHVASDMLQRLLDRTRQQWTALGDNDPFYSVLTSPSYRSAVITPEALVQFRASGERDADLVRVMALRDNAPPPGGSCLEFGCGVGRITRYLAKRFDHVIGVDISPGNLELARQYLEEDRVYNVELQLISNIDNIEQLPNCDYFYSLIVFQHNSPPVQFKMLKTLLSKISPGGSCLFQIIADIPGSRFIVEEYLETEYPEMELHVLPMPYIVQALRETGMELQGMRLDPWTGLYGSYTITARRP